MSLCYFLRDSVCFCVRGHTASLYCHRWMLSSVKSGITVQLHTVLFFLNSLKGDQNCCCNCALTDVEPALPRM